MNSQKNELPVLLSAFLITGALAVGGGYLFFNKKGNDVLINSSPTTSATTAGENNNLSWQISTGNKNLVTTEGSSKPGFIEAKNAGITATSARDFPLAEKEFERALKIDRNAPETIIYHNNAAIGERPSYTIAVVIPLQSDLNGALELLRGVAQAQTETNRKGGIGGVPLRVAIVDDAGDTKLAADAAQKLVEDPQVLAVIGHYSSDSTLAAGEVYDRGKLPVISAVSSSVKLTNFKPFVFRTIPSDYVAGRALADYSLKTLQRRKAIVFFNSASGYSSSLKSEFATALSLGGGTIVQEIDMHATDFSPSKALERGKDADIIMLAANTGTLDKALQVVGVNNGRLPLLGGDDVYAPKTLEIGKSQANGMVVAVPWHIDANPTAAFNQATRRFWQADVNWRTTLAYDAAAAAIAAIQQSPTRQGVRDSLANPNFQAVGGSGPVRFLASGDRSGGIQLVKVSPGKKSGHGFDFIPVK